MSKLFNELVILKDYILVKGIIENEEVGGLVKPTQYDDKASCGTVLKVGPESKIPIGSVVYFNKYSSVIFPFEGEEFLVLRDEDAVAYHS